MRKSNRTKGRTAKSFMVHVVAVEQQPPNDFHLDDELSDYHREDLREMLFDNFPELLQPVDSPCVSRPWDHPVDTTGRMRH
jgi:hypothetical protein